MKYKTDNLLLTLNSLSKISNILERFKDYYKLDALKQYMRDDHLKFGCSAQDKCAEGFDGVNEFFNHFDKLLSTFKQLSNDSNRD